MLSYLEKAISVLTHSFASCGDGGAFGNQDGWIHAAIRRAPRNVVEVRTRCEACELWDAVASDTANG